MSEDRSSERRTYNADAIQVLDPTACFRQRPGMYVGDVHDGSGLLHMVWELVGNALDQHLARRASRVEVDVSDEGWITVTDDGPGIPVEPYGETGLSFLEVVFTRMFGSGFRDRHLPHVHLGAEFLGWGVAPVCALSERLEVETRRDGQMWTAAFEKGHLVSPLRARGRVGGSRTTIRFRPDASIFQHPRVDTARLEARLRELSWLFPHFGVHWSGSRLPWRGGPAGWVRMLSEGEVREGECFEFAQGTEDGYVDIALAWTKRPEATVRAFVNGTEARRGTHVAGMWKGLVDVARGFGCDAEPGVIRELLEPGLVAVLHVGLIGPRYNSPTREDLTSPVARTVVACAIERGLSLAMRTGFTGRSPGDFGSVLASRLSVTPSFDGTR